MSCCVVIMLLAAGAVAVDYAKLSGSVTTPEAHLNSRSVQLNSSYDEKNGGRFLYHDSVNTSYLSESHYPIHNLQTKTTDDQVLENKGVHSESRHYKTSNARMLAADTNGPGNVFRSYNTELYTQPNTYSQKKFPVFTGNKKMDTSDIETSTKIITSYDADKNPVLRPKYNQAEPPLYPPLEDFESSVTDKDDGYNSFSNSQPDMSYVPDFESYSYHSATSPENSGMSFLYHNFKPNAGYEDVPDTNDKGQMPVLKEASMIKIPFYPSSEQAGSKIMTKPTDMKMPGQYYNEVPYNPDNGDQYLPYNPETSENIFVHTSHDSPESEDSNSNSYDHQYHHPGKMPLKDSKKPVIHEEENDDFDYHDITFYGTEPSSHVKQSGGKMKPSFHIYSSSEDDTSNMKPSMSKSKLPPPPPPPPEEYFTGPHKGKYKDLHDLDTYLDHDQEGHKDEHEHHPEPEDHNSDYRLNKRPYSYYYLGRKLWYIPLYFSVYFIVYVTALILKSIARHKIRYPITHWSSRSLADDGTLKYISTNVTKALSHGEKLFM